MTVDLVSFIGLIILYFTEAGGINIKILLPTSSNSIL